MEAAELRRRFLTYFEENGHAIVPSASLIPHDPELLFTIAGMVPFKPYFVGDETPAFSRAASIQKVFRAPDIDQIGTTKRHLTFFEMMGNFSFGDYFKQEAIEFAWGLITESFGFDPEQLWVTVHVSDNDASDIWQSVAGIRPERIQRLDEDNFWAMGDVGPCGPCSEIYFDKGPKYGSDGGPAQGDGDRFVEFWNLVFMQYNRGSDGSLLDLPRKNIDTGAGFERVLSIRNNEDSVFVGARLQWQFPGVVAQFGLAVARGADRHKKDLGSFEREQARTFRILAVIADLDTHLGAAKIEHREFGPRRKIEFFVTASTAGKLRGQDRGNVGLAVDAELLAALVRH